MIWLFNHWSEFEVVSAFSVWCVACVVEFAQVGSDFLNFRIVVVLEYLSISAIEVVSTEASTDFEGLNLFSCDEASNSGLDLDEKSKLVHGQVVHLPLEISLRRINTSLDVLVRAATHYFY